MRAPEPKATQRASRALLTGGPMAGAGEELVPLARVERAIVEIRGERVLLDEDLAELYGVPTGALNQAVGRNLERFPADFMFRLTRQELRDLKSQSVISRWGGRRKLPRAFTEQGVAMLSSVLRSPRAVQVNVEIMRVFVRLRRLLASDAELAAKLAALEQRTGQSDKKTELRFRVVFAALAKLRDAPVPPERQIGFKGGGEGKTE